MQTIYQFYDRRIFTGVTRDIEDHEGAPLSWTFNAPPDLQDGQFASFSGPEWVILNAYPETFTTPIEAKPTIAELQEQLAVLTAKIKTLSQGV